MAKNNRRNVPAGIELEDLKGPLEPILGFIRKPTDEAPSAMRFSGILMAAVGQGTDNRWYAVRAMGEQHCTYSTQENRDEELEVKDGDVLGLSHTGALSGLEKKIGHYIVVTYTGKKVPLKGGRAMWECAVQVSKRAIEPRSNSSADAEIPF